VATSTDGQSCAVTLRVSDHRPEPSRRSLNDIADRLRINRAEIEEALASWTHEQLVAHLETFTADELKAPAIRSS